MTTNNQTEALKPCPFCGSDRVDPTSDDGLHWVRCRTCGATGPGATKYSDEDEPDWNRRALSATAAPVQQEPKPCMKCDDSVGYKCEDCANQAAPQQEVELDCIEFDASGKLASADVIVNGERVKLGTQAHRQESDREAFEKWADELGSLGLNRYWMWQAWQARALKGQPSAPAQEKEPYGYAAEGRDGHITFFKQRPSGFDGDDWKELMKVIPLYERPAATNLVQQVTTTNCQHVWKIDWLPCGQLGQVCSKCGVTRKVIEEHGFSRQIQEEFEDWLKSHYPDAQGETVVALGDAWLAGRDSGYAKTVTCQLYGHPLQTCGECNHEQAVAAPVVPDTPLPENRIIEIAKSNGHPADGLYIGFLKDDLIEFANQIRGAK